MLSPHPDGVVVEVWVAAGASRDSIAGVHDGALRVSTAQPPEGGRANRAVADLLKSHFGASRVSILSGARGRRKRFLIEGVAAEAAALRIPE